MNSKMNKKIYLFTLLLINCFIIFGNNTTQKTNQDFIEAIKKTYSNHKFPLIHAHNIFYTLYKEYLPTISLTNNLKTTEDNSSIQASPKNSHLFNDKYLENLKQALIIIKNSTEFSYESELKKKSDENKKIIESNDKNMKNLELIKNCILILTSFYIFNVFLTLKKDHKFNIFGLIGQFIFRPFHI